MAEAGPEVVVLRDEEELAREAAQRIVAILARAVAARGRADIALTGGSSAGALYRQLTLPTAESALDWSRVHLWFGDERFVPSDHPLSNARVAREALLGAQAHGGQSGSGLSGTDIRAGLAAGLPIAPDQFHEILAGPAIEGGGGPEAAAAAYAEALRGALPPGPDGLPRFDLVLLGVGPDGHILSVFPGSSALEPGTPLASAIPAPDHVDPHVPRVTLDPRLVGAAAAVLVMVPGAVKAPIVGRIFGTERDPRQWPAQLALVPTATWLLDEASAAELPRA